MGRRSSTETPIAVLAAFIDDHSWKQADLAAHVGVTTRVLRRCLDELSRNGIPLESEAESKREIVWSVPKKWLPRAVGLSTTRAAACVRLLARLPQSELRDDLIRHLVGPAALALARSDRAEPPLILAAVEDAMSGRRALRLVYASSNSGTTRARFVSVHHIAYGDRGRFAATCHERGALSWWRLDRVHQAQIASTEPFRPSDPESVRAFVAGSVGGFHRGSPTECRFWVRDPESAWVVPNLPVANARTKAVAGGVEVTVTTAGIEILARLVVGLGGIAVPWTPELANRVRALADGTLTALGNRTSAAARVRKSPVRASVARPRQAAG